MENQKIRIPREFLSKNADVLLALAIIILVTFLLVGRFLLAEGTVLFGDFVPTLETRQFLRTCYPLWSNRNTFNYVGAMRLPYLLIFYFPFYAADVPADFFFKFMIFGTLVLSGISMYATTRHFLRKYNADVKTVFLCCMIPSIFYALNPWVMDRVYHIFLLVTYSFVPFIFLLSVKVFSGDTVDLKRLLVLVLLCSIASTSPHSVFFILLLIASLYFFSLGLNYKQFVSRTKNLALFGILYFLINAFWILPLANYGLSVGSLSPDYVTQINNLNAFSRNSELPNVLSLVAYWWPKVSHSFEVSFLNSLWVFASLIIPAFCFLAIVFYRKNRVAVYLSILSLVLIFLAGGTRSALPGFYEWLCFDAPILSSFGWLFRDPNKWTILLPLGYSVLFAFACLGSIRLTSKFRAKASRKMALSVLVLLLFSSLFIYITPSATNYFEGPFKPVQVPPEILRANHWLENDSSSCNVLWLPSYAEYGASWVYSGLSGSFELDSSAKPTLDSMSKYSRGYLNYFDMVLLENRSSHTAEYLNPLNIRYVIFHNDSASPEFANRLFQSLQHNEGFELVKQDGIVYIFENRDWSQNVFQPFGNVAVVVGGFDKTASAKALGLNFSFVFADQGSLNDNIDFDTFVLSGDFPNDVVPFFLNESLVLSPFDFTRRHSPAEDWSRASLSDLSGGPFHPYLQQLGIECWDSDYDKGVVLTWAQHARLTIPFNLASSGNYSLSARIFESTAGGRVAVYLDDLPVETVETRSQASRFVWKTISSLSVKSGMHTLTLENIDGFNSINLIAIAPDEKALTMEQRLKGDLQGKDLLYAFEAESDMIAENASVSTDHGGEASNGLVVELNSSSRVSRGIELVCPGNYSFAFRGEGSMILKVDGNAYEIHLDQFGWIFLGPIALSSGKHTIEVTSSSENKAELDVLWISKSGANRASWDTLAANHAAARVMSIREIDPTKFIIEFEADKPFMLHFANSYDPAWSASFNGQSAKSVRLFGVANGFWINAVGKVSVTVVFQPQLWFYIGLAISSASLFLCTGVILYLWHRRKHPRAS